MKHAGLDVPVGAMSYWPRPELAYGGMHVLTRFLATLLFDTPPTGPLTGKPAKSLHRMLSASGNPSMDNLAVIFDAVRNELGVGIKVKTARAAPFSPDAGVTPRAHARFNCPIPLLGRPPGRPRCASTP